METAEALLEADQEVRLEPNVIKDDLHWEKKFDPPTIDKLPRMKWAELFEKMAAFIDLMTRDIDAGCMACPAVTGCNRRDCKEHLTAWAKDKMRCKWDQ